MFLRFFPNQTGGVSFCGHGRTRTRTQTDQVDFFSWSEERPGLRPEKYPKIVNNNKKLVHSIVSESKTILLAHNEHYFGVHTSKRLTKNFFENFQ